MTAASALGVIFVLAAITCWLGVIAGHLRNIAQSQEKIAAAAQDGLRTARARLTPKD